MTARRVSDLHSGDSIRIPLDEFPRIPRPPEPFWRTVATVHTSHGETVLTLTDGTHGRFSADYQFDWQPCGDTIVSPPTIRLGPSLRD